MRLYSMDSESERFSTISGPIMADGLEGEHSHDRKVGFPVTVDVGLGTPHRT